MAVNRGGAAVRWTLWLKRIRAWWPGRATADGPPTPDREDLIRTRLEAAGLEEGVQQLLRLQAKRKAFDNALELRFKASEITSVRYHEALERAWSSALANLEEATVAIEGANAVDRRWMEKRLAILRKEPPGAQRDNEIETLQDRARTAREALATAQSKLTQNEALASAIDTLVHALGASWAHGDEGSRIAERELGRLASRTARYAELENG